MLLEFWSRVKGTWEAQSSGRREAILNITLKRIKQQTRDGGSTLLLNESPIFDTHAQGTSDLPLTELDDPVSQASSPYREIGHCDRVKSSMKRIDPERTGARMEYTASLIQNKVY